MSDKEEKPEISMGGTEQAISKNFESLVSVYPDIVILLSEIQNYDQAMARAAMHAIGTDYGFKWLNDFLFRWAMWTVPVKRKREEGIIRVLEAQVRARAEGAMGWVDQLRNLVQRR